MCVRVCVYVCPGEALSQALTKLARSLLRVEQFYNSLGGVLGYQTRSLGLIVEGSQALRRAKTAAEQAASNGAPAKVRAAMCVVSACLGLFHVCMRR